MQLHHSQQKVLYADVERKILLEMVSFSQVLISTRDVAHESMSDESDIYFDITLQPFVYKNDRFVEVLWVCGCINC